MGNVDLDAFEKPDGNCEYNYLLDTTVFNRFAEHKDWLDLAERSLELGFHYYKTANQDYELSGCGAKTYDKNCVPQVKISDNFRAKMEVFEEIKNRLKIKRVSSIACLMRNHWILDGTYRILDEKSTVGKMTEEILQFNEDLRKSKPFAQHYDAMSAEAAMYYGCFLVSDDTDLRDIVNNYFSQKCIGTKDLVDLIRGKLEVEQIKE